MNKYLSQSQLRALEKLFIIEFSLAPYTCRTMRSLEAKGYAELRLGDRGQHNHRWYPTEAGKCALFEYVGENHALRNPPVPDS